MPPKKKEQQKMSLGDFLSDAGFGGSSNWADEVEENYGTQPLPASDRSRMGGGASTSMWQDRGYSVRESAPVSFPEKPPYTAHLGNLNYDVTDEAVKEFFEGCEVASVRLIEDRETMRPKGFGYVEFATPEGLTKALNLDGESFGGRTVRIKIADPPRGGDSGRGDTIREMGDWTRKGPLPDAPRGGGRPTSDFGERRAPRDPASSFENRPARDFTWERHGPLAPIPGQQGPGSRDGSRPRAAGGEGMGERSESYRGNNRRQSPAAWREGRPEGGPRGEFTERPPRPERVPTAAEKDGKWRERMRPDQAAKSPEVVSTPPSPALSSAAPAQGGRPRLNLQKRTVSEAKPSSPSAASDSKASPFGAARPIDTAAREREIEEKKIQAAQEKQEAEEKAKEEKRIAKEEAAKAEAAREEAAKEEAAKAESAKAEAAKAAKAEEDAKAPAPAEAEAPKAEGEAAQKGSEEQKPAPRTRENPKSRANESSSWRSAGGERGPRGPPSGPRGGRGGQARGGRNEGRGPRANGQAAQPAQAAQSPASPIIAEPETPTADEDGWTTVIMPKKGRGGRV